jgi:hypothetical protein
MPFPQRGYNTTQKALSRGSNLLTTSTTSDSKRHSQQQQDIYCADGPKKWGGIYKHRLLGEFRPSLALLKFTIVQREACTPRTKIPICYILALMGRSHCGRRDCKVTAWTALMWKALQFLSYSPFLSWRVQLSTLLLDLGSLLVQGCYHKRHLLPSTHTHCMRR